MREVLLRLNLQGVIGVIAEWIGHGYRIHLRIAILRERSQGLRNRAAESRIRRRHKSLARAVWIAGLHIDVGMEACAAGLVGWKPLVGIVHQRLQVITMLSHI